MIFHLPTVFMCNRNASFESLEFLTVEQSLADIATFIRFIRLDPSVGYFTKLILWGSGYGGSMAVWARKKYPGLIDGVSYIDTHPNFEFNNFKLYEIFRSGHRVGYSIFHCTVSVSQNFLHIPIKPNQNNAGQYDALESIFHNSGSSGCTELLRDALYEIDSLIQNGEGEHLQETLNLCHPVDTNSPFDIGALYENYILFVTDYINRLQ